MSGRHTYCWELCAGDTHIHTHTAIYMERVTLTLTPTPTPTPTPTQEVSTGTPTCVNGERGMHPGIYPPNTHTRMYVREMTHHAGPHILGGPT